MGGGGGAPPIPGSEPLPVSPFANAVMPPGRGSPGAPGSVKGAEAGIFAGLPNLNDLFNIQQGMPSPFPNSLSFPQRFLQPASQMAQPAPASAPPVTVPAPAPALRDQGGSANPFEREGRER